MPAPARLRASASLLLSAALACSAWGRASEACAQAQPQAPAQPPAQAPAPSAVEPPEYRKTIDDAVREFRAGHWEEARALFGRAHQIEPSARTLRGLGMTAFELRMYVQSLRELDAALKDARKPLDASMREAAGALIAKARAFVARVQLAPNPANAALLIDGRAPQPEAEGGVLLDAGTHVVSATADGYKPTSLRFSVEGGRDQVLQLPLEPLLAVNAVPAIDPNHPPPPAQPEAATPPPAAPPPASRSASDNGAAPALRGGAASDNGAAPALRGGAASEPSPLIGTLAWVTLGGAVAFGGAAAATWLIGDKNYDDLDTCSPACSDDEIDESGVATTDTLTNVFLGVAIASGVASGVLFAVSLSGSGEAKADTVALGVSPQGVRLQGAF